MENFRQTLYSFKGYKIQFMHDFSLSWFYQHHVNFTMVVSCLLKSWNNMFIFKHKFILTSRLHALYSLSLPQSTNCTNPVDQKSRKKTIRRLWFSLIIANGIDFSARFSQACCVGAWKLKGRTSEGHTIRASKT